MISVVLLMAGKGTRMGYEKNKILLPLGDKYLFEYPLALFLSRGYEIICVLSEEDQSEIIPRLPEGVQWTLGGKTRQESVLQGLKKATGDYIMIHDAARVFIDHETIDAIEALGNVPVLTYFKVKDTIKRIHNGKLETLVRSELVAASTPQCAPRQLFLDVYEKAREEGFQATDDISLIEKYYPEMIIQLVEANEESFKVTTPIDYENALRIWREKQ